MEQMHLVGILQGRDETNREYEKDNEYLQKAPLHLIISQHQLKDSHGKGLNYLCYMRGRHR